MISKSLEKLLKGFIDASPPAEAASQSNFYKRLAQRLWAFSHEAVRPRPSGRIAPYGLTAAAQRFMTPEADQLSLRIQHDRPLGLSLFDEVCTLALPKMADLPFGPQIEYLDYHNGRFYELDNVTTVLMTGMDNPIILDVGMSINTIILQQLFPEATVMTADRSNVSLHPSQPIKLFNVDLADPKLDKLDLIQRFDIILFAEVIEHLLANPVRVLNFLIRHMTPHGFLVITTPNFFSGANIRAMENRENPQPIFPANLKRGEEISHHVREYSMSELLTLSVEAGGYPVAFFYSSCWDDPASTVPEEHRSNLYVVVSREMPRHISG